MTDTRPGTDPEPDGRYFAVIVTEEGVRGPDGPITKRHGLSRRADDPSQGTRENPEGRRFGPWAMLTEWEAEGLRDAWLAAPTPEGVTCTAEVVEFFRWDDDPEWPEEWS